MYAGLRRTFATQMLRAGYDVRTVQRVMGHRDVRTTLVYVEASPTPESDCAAHWTETAGGIRSHGLCSCLGCDRRHPILEGCSSENGYQAGAIGGLPLGSRLRASAIHPR
jgi:hypothetical protein